DTCGAEIRNRAEVLPDIETGGLDLLADDGIGLAKRLETVARDVPEAAKTSRPRSRTCAR
ncbi:MAG: hypothetical protein ACOYIP_08815, partial [Coriobacteriales bacterium]